MTQVLPALDELYDLSAADVDRFRRDGHVALREVCGANEIDAYAPIIREAALADSDERRPIEERDTYGKAFLQIENLWPRHEAVRPFSLSRRFGRIAADLLGVDDVRVYHDQALFKEPGGGRTPWHQDQYYWPLDTDETITMWMPLIDVPAEIGTMTFVSGSHRKGYLGEFDISDESDDAFASMIEAEGLSTHTHGALRAGDATFHKGWTLHSAPANPTGVMRAVMTVIYFADGAHITEPKNRYHERDRTLFLGGVEPGQPATSELNPVVSTTS